MFIISCILLKRDYQKFSSEIVREVVSVAEQEILEFHLADNFRNLILQPYLIEYYLYVLEYFFFG